MYNQIMTGLENTKSWLPKVLSISLFNVMFSTANTSMLVDIIRCHCFLRIALLIHSQPGTDLLLRYFTFPVCLLMFLFLFLPWASFSYCSYCFLERELLEPLCYYSLVWWVGTGESFPTKFTIHILDMACYKTNHRRISLSKLSKPSFPGETTWETWKPF